MTYLPLHRVPTFYSYEPAVVDDFGNLVPSDWDSLGQYLNTEFTSVPAAKEYYGVAADLLPVLI